MTKRNKPVMMDEKMIDRIEKIMISESIFSFGEVTRRLIDKGLEVEESNAGNKKERF